MCGRIAHSYMEKAHDKTVQEAQYNLRPNAERARIAAECRQKTDIMETSNNPKENTNSCEVRYNISAMNHAAAVVTQTVRFCGHVES